MRVVGISAAASVAWMLGMTGLSGAAHGTTSAAASAQPEQPEQTEQPVGAPDCDATTDLRTTSIRFEGTDIWAQLNVGAHSGDLEFADLARSRYRSLNNRYPENDVSWREMSPQEREWGASLASNPLVCMVRSQTNIGGFILCAVEDGVPSCERWEPPSTD